MKIIHTYIIILLILIVYAYFNRYEVFIYNKAPMLVRYNKLNGNVEFNAFIQKKGWRDAQDIYDEEIFGKIQEKKDAEDWYNKEILKR